MGSYEDGFFCGWLFGDGWITYRRTGEVQVGLCVAMVDSDVLPLLTDKLKEFGCEAVFKKNKNGRLYQVILFVKCKPPIWQWVCSFLFVWLMFLLIVMWVVMRMDFFVVGYLEMGGLLIGGLEKFKLVCV